MTTSALALVALALLGAGPAAGDYFPPADPKAGGIRDLMLIYLGQDSWSPRDFLPYVAYLGKEPVKRPRDWFYDSYLFLAYGGAPSGTTYIDGASNKADWQFYFDQLLFREGHSLAALEACIHDVERTLGRRPKVPVILMIPYPSRSQKDCGDVDGDGRNEDLSQPADRLKAVRWCVDEMLRRWQQTRFTSLTLWGFYWMNEGIGPRDEAIVRATADYVHGRGYGLHWIPYYRASGCDKLPELGIDFAVLQPNYAFMEQGGRRPEEQRLSDTACQARRRHMGIEIEMTAIAGRGERDNLWDYLAHGRDGSDGYMRHAVHAYYQGENTIARLCHSAVAADRDLYEALYQFAKGTFQGPRERLATGCSYRIQGQLVPAYPDDRRKLTDGHIASGPATADRLVGLSGQSPRIELDLGEPRRIASVALRVATRGTAAQGLPASAACPQCFDVAVSTTGRDWQPAGRGYRWYATPGEQITAGEMVAEFAPCDARLVAITVHQASGKIALVDELLVEPGASLTDNAQCQLSPVPTTADASGATLLDACYQRPGSSPDRSVAWATDQQASIVLQLHDPRHLGLVRVHTPQVEAIERLDVLARVDGATDWKPIGRAARHGNFLDLDVGAAFTGQLKFVAALRPGGRVVLDEIEIEVLAAGKNVALGRPYHLRPAPASSAPYADTTGKLTDGQYSTAGFGRAVGWDTARPRVVVDLGLPVAVGEVAAHVVGGGPGGVYFPEKMAVSISVDGLHWEPDQATSERPPESGHEAALGTLRVRFPSRPCRYVRLEFQRHGWLMLDEVEVYGPGNGSLNPK